MNKSIAEVGFAVGLSNTPYFITLFKNRTGQTPKQYQKTMREIQENGGKTMKVLRIGC